MRYGLPYQGSKSRIADWVVGNLPSAPVLVDIMCGGGAVSHAALLSGKYGRVVLNDVNGMADVFVKAARGEFADYSFVPDREQFHAMKDSDPLVSLLYSFGNNRRDYLWSRAVEPVKVAASRMLSAGSLRERRGYWRVFCCELVKYVQTQGAMPNRLRNLQGLEALERLERLERLDIFNIDYKEFDVVYFDIPYKGTNKYDFEFDYEKFYDLFKSLKTDLKINAFLSEYDAPFTCVAEFEKMMLMSVSVGSPRKTCKEKLYFNGTHDEYRALMGADYAPKVEQTALFSLF